MGASGLSSVPGVDLAEAAMVAWREELARREAVAAERVEDLRGRVEELGRQLEVAEQLLSRLVVTRETMNAILTETGGSDWAGESGSDDGSGPNAETAPPQRVSDGGSRIGLVLVPPRTPGTDAAAVLPEDYCDILAVLAEAGGGLRAGQVAAELGISTADRSKVEALRSKVKRLVARGWVDQQPSGVFTIIE